jgi:putative nucleotidyltransferase with HDIG domain
VILNPNSQPLDRLPIRPATPRDIVEGEACVQSWQPTISKAGNAYVTARIGHRDGTIVLRLFEGHLGAWNGIATGDAVHITLSGRAGSGGYGLSWECVSVRRLDDSHPIRQDLLPACPVPYDELCARWDVLVQRLSPMARALLYVVLEEVGEDAYRAAPAAKGQHHAVAPYGLWWHSLEVAEYALALAACQARYRPLLSTDLLIIGGLLHDVGKTKEYQVEPGVGILMAPMSAGRYHTTVGIQLVAQAVTRHAPMLAAAGTPTALIDGLYAIIESHHAQREWGSPTAPSSLEGWFIHAADMASANAAKIHDQLATATPCPEAGWYRTANGRPDYVQAFHELASSPVVAVPPAPESVLATSNETAYEVDVDWITVTIDQEHA